MIAPLRQDIPEDHPLRQLFLTLTERGMDQLHHRDRQTVAYLADMLTNFVYTDNLNRIEFNSALRFQYLTEVLSEASSQMSPEARRAYFRHAGDVVLFNLGLFPEQLTYGRRLLSPDYYAAQGRRSYYIAAQTEYDSETAILHKLSDHFEECVAGLNWVKAYIQDPFYQYMFRQFTVT